MQTFRHHESELFSPHSLTDAQVNSAVLSAPELDGEYRHGTWFNELVGE